MTITRERKTELIGEFKLNENDTGSPEVQIAILTSRINGLTEHLRTHKKDFWIYREEEVGNGGKFGSVYPNDPWAETFPRTETW